MNDRSGWREPGDPRSRGLLPMVGLLAALGLPAKGVTGSIEQPHPRAIAHAMTADTWTVAPPVGWAGDAPGSAKFARYEGMATGAMTLNEGIGVSRDARFSSGAIDFDIKPLGYSDAGVIFRRGGGDDGEFVYLRANPDCPAANDCIQYAPIVHGLMQWDIYPDHQGPAPISPTGWNHIHLQIAGSQMLVYVNHAAEPSLVVPKLQGKTLDGRIAFKGPAIYANLVVRPGDPSPLPGVADEPADPLTVYTWLSAPPSARDPARPVLASALPASNAWRPIAAEPSGLVNLSREFGAARAPASSVGWLKTVVTASRPMRRTVQIGFARQAWVFLNGRQVYSGENPYYPEERRLSPDGRLEAENASITLDLKRGRNELVLAVGNDWRTHAGVHKPSPYGWAAEAHFTQIEGLHLD